LNHDDIMERWIKDFKQQYVPPLLQRYQILYYQLEGVPQSLVLKLSKLPWFVTTVAETHSNINASEFIVFFLKAACSLVAENPKNTSNVQNMIDNILMHIRLHDKAVDIILSDILTCDFFKNENSAMNAKYFLARFYQIFELSYPENFDKHLNNLMKQNDERSKLALYFLLSWPFINVHPLRCWGNWLKLVRLKCHL